MNWSRLNFSNETELESIILKNKILENHYVFDFKESLNHSSVYNRYADLLVIHSDFKYWSIVEVEFSNHSFKDHIFPQLLEIYTLVNKNIDYIRERYFGTSSFKQKEVVDLIQFNKPFLSLIIDRVPHQYSSSIPLLNTFCNIITVNRVWDKYENYFYLCDYYLTNEITNKISPCYINENIMLVDRPNIVGLNHSNDPVIKFNEKDYKIHQQSSIIRGVNTLFWLIDGNIRNGRYILKYEEEVLVLKRG